MTYYLKNGLVYTPANEEALNLQRTLPVGNYVVKVNNMTGSLYFEMIEDFPDPGKVYGDHAATASRILNTFELRPASTGVLLVGEKGSGKTLLTKLLGIQARERGWPTIIINAPFHGDAFNQLIQNLEQPALVLFDEFEKVYDSDSQQAILTLLDGVFPTKKLFMLTCNDLYRVDEHMINRPGRIYYNLEFGTLEREFIVEYCNDRLNDTQHIDTICNLAAAFDQLNFDMLKALVEEMNRYNETPQQALKMLNVKPRPQGSTAYDITIELPTGETVDDISPSQCFGSPLVSGDIHLDYWFRDADNEIQSGPSFSISPRDLKELNSREGLFTFVTPQGIRVTFRKQAQHTPAYLSYF